LLIFSASSIRLRHPMAVGCVSGFFLLCFSSAPVVPAGLDGSVLMWVVESSAPMDQRIGDGDFRPTFFPEEDGQTRWPQVPLISRTRRLRSPLLKQHPTQQSHPSQPAKRFRHHTVAFFPSHELPSLSLTPLHVHPRFVAENTFLQLSVWSESGGARVGGSIWIVNGCAPGPPRARG